MRCTASFLGILLVACGGSGGGNGDTSSDTQQDALDTVWDADMDQGQDDVMGEVECSSDGECDDSNPCTVDSCDLDYNECTHEAVDADGDGYAAMEVGGTSCTGGSDCDDGDADVHPEAILDCTGGGDFDCDDEPDDDEDGDGFATTACGGDDCDDGDASVFPESPAVDCTTGDHDCNGEEDADNDGDGHDRAGCGIGDDCDDADDLVNPDRTENYCNGKDDDCNGVLYPDEDVDRDNYPNPYCAAPGLTVDCDDGDNTIHPGAPEICDQLDQDCDGTWADGGADDDGDGFLDPACGGDDCDDGDATANPGARENCWMVVSAGVFTMGSLVTEPGRNADETQHTVTLTHDFEMMATEVTQDQFLSQMGYQPSSYTTCGGRCPVESVSWHEAAAYANALSAGEGLASCYSCTGTGATVACGPSAGYSTPFDCPGYRLPTEAEWEYAARAGTTGGTYNGTCDASHLACEMPNATLEPIAWFCGNSSGTTNFVACKTPNPWGLFDMLGNVWEWCHDWYDAYPGTITDPWGAITGTRKSVRGGAYSCAGSYLRTAYRNNPNPLVHDQDIGFRVVRSL